MRLCFYVSPLTEKRTQDTTTKNLLGGKDKMAKNNLQIFFVIAVIAVIGMLAYSQGYIGSQSAISPGQGGSVAVDIIDNTASSTTFTMGYAFDKLAPTTKLTTETHEYFLGSSEASIADVTSITDGTAKTLAPGNAVRVILGSTSGDYYAKDTGVFVIPDTGSTSLTTLGIDTGLYKNGSSTVLTQTFVNDGGTTTNGASAEQVIGSGESVEITMSVKGTYQRAFSPGADMLMVCNINKSTIDTLSVEGFTSTNMIPSQHTVGVDDRAVAFLMPGLIGTDSKKIDDVVVVIQAKAGTNPGNGEDIECTFYDQDMYQNSNTGTWQMGYEDNTASDVGGANPTGTFYYS